MSGRQQRSNRRRQAPSGSSSRGGRGNRGGRGKNKGKTKQRQQKQNGNGVKIKQEQTTAAASGSNESGRQQQRGAGGGKQRGFDARADLEGRFEMSGHINMDPIKAQLEQIQQAVALQTYATMSGKQRRREPMATSAVPSRENGGAADERSALRTLYEMSLEDLVAGSRGVVADDIGEQSFRDIKNIMSKPMMPMYSFDPSSDMHAIGSAVNKLHNGEEAQNRSAKERKRAASTTVRELLENDSVELGACFESLRQTMWWYPVSIGSKSAAVLPAAASMAPKKLADFVSSRSNAMSHQCALTTALSIRKSAWDVGTSWGYALDRATSNPGAPMWADVEMSRSALYHYATLIDAVLEERVAENYMDLLRSFALSWEGDAPTIQEYRGFLCSLMAVKTGGARQREKLRGILAEVADQFAVFVEQYSFGDDDDDDDDLFDEEDRIEKRSIMWATHCMVYSPLRGFTPGMYFGEQGCRWYLAADEDNACASSDLSPVLTGTPMSVSKPVERVFVGDARTTYRRLATGRTALYGEYSVETPSVDRAGLYQEIQLGLLDERRDTSMLRNTSPDLLPRRASLSERKAQGLPKLRPTVEDVTYTTTMPNQKGSRYKSEDVADLLRESVEVDRAQKQFERSNKVDLGAPAANMMHCAESAPAYRIFHDVHTGVKLESGRVRRAYNSLMRTRMLGECMHQWARDIASIYYWLGETRLLESWNPKVLADSDRTYLRAFPETPSRANHVGWAEEVVRINYEVYFRRALLQDFDESSLAADIESDAAVRVRPISDDESVRRVMMPCAARRSLSATPLTLEEVRSQYFNMLSDVHAYARSDSSHNAPMSVTKLTSVRFVRRYINWFSASAISKWVRMWCAVEGVDRIDSEGSFKQRTMPILHRYSLAPKIGAEFARALQNSAIRTARAEDPMRWNGDYFSASFDDDNYVWLYCADESRLQSLVEHINERVGACQAFAEKRAQEMVFSSLVDRAQNTEIRLNYEPAMNRSSGPMARVRHAMLLLLGAGVFADRQTFATGRRYYLDVLNSLTSRADAYERGEVPSELALSIDYDPMFGWFARAVNSQFSSALRPEFYMHLREMEQERPGRASIYDALISASTSGGAMPDTNLAYNLAHSILQQVGVCTLVGSPIRHLVWSFDSVGGQDAVVRNQTQAMSTDLLTSIVNYLPVERESVVSVYSIGADMQSRYSALLRRVNMECANYTARQCNKAAFVANNLSIGDSRHDLFQYASDGGLFLPNSVDRSMAPADLADYIGDASSTRWLGRYDLAMWHNYAPYVVRRRHEVESAHKHARVAREDTNLLTEFAMDRAERGVEPDPILRFVAPKITDDLDVETKQSIWSFYVVQLSSYFWAPYSADSRVAKNPRLYSETTIEARNKRTLYRGVVGPMLSSTVSNHWSMDMLRNTRIAMDRERRAFSHFLENDIGARTTVYVNGITSIRMRPATPDVAAYSASLKPYPLRCPGIDYAVFDWTNFVAGERTAADVYTSYADHRGFRAFVLTSYHSEGLGMRAATDANERAIDASMSRLPTEHRYAYEFLPENPINFVDQYAQPVFAVQTHQTVIYT